MENNGQAHQAYDPTQALADATASREAVARRLVTPWWYHPVLGANLGLLVLLVAYGDVLSHMTFMFGAFASLCVSLALISTYKRLTGLWVGFGEVGPRARRMWVAYGIVIVVATIAAAIAGPVLDLPQIGIVLAIVCAVTTIVLGRRMDDTMREELRDGSMPVPGLPR